MSIAVALLGAVWWLQRQGRRVPDRALSRAVGGSVAILVVVAGWGVATAWFNAGALPPLHLPPIAVFSSDVSASRPLRLFSIAIIPLVASLAAGFGLAIPAIGGVDVLSQVALDLEQPRIRNLQRTARLVGAFGLVVTGAFAFLFVALVPEAHRNAWVTAPLAGVALGLAGPGWLRAFGLVAVICAAAVFLSAAVRSAAAGAHGVLSRLVDEGILGAALRFAPRASARLEIETGRGIRSAQSRAGRPRVRGRGRG